MIFKAHGATEALKQSWNTPKWNTALIIAELVVGEWEFFDLCSCQDLADDRTVCSILVSGRSHDLDGNFLIFFFPFT